MSATRRNVIVVGSGAAGLAAALAAAANGASVKVLEASEFVGGTTAMSGGVVWIPGSPWAAKEGIDDAAESGVEYLRGLELGDVDPVMAAAYVREGVRVIARIESETPVRWHFLGGPDYHAELPGGHAIGRGLEILPVQVAHEVLARVRPDPYDEPPATLSEADRGEPGPKELDRRRKEGVVARGRGLIAGMLAALCERGVEVRTGVRAMSLVIANGTVSGVESEGERFEGAVIIASGGFERNPALARAFLRGPLLAPAGPPSNRGDGLVMGMSAGAALGNMSEAWWAPAMHVPGETIDGAPFFRMLFRDCAQAGCIAVDANGDRFVNEAVNYSDFGRAFHNFDSAGYTFPACGAWLIFDAGSRAYQAFVGERGWSLAPRKADRGRDESVNEEAPEWLVRAPNIGALAEKIGIPPQRLRATVERFNDQVARGVDDDFGRGSYIYDHFSQGGQDLKALGETPFYALRLLPGSLGTKGGLKTDESGRVMRADGKGTISGLYAAGNAAANPFGCGYPGPGSTIGPALVFGWCAGEASLG